MIKKNLFFLTFIIGALSLNAQIFKPLDKMSDVERSAFLAEHYWDGFKFYDTMILNNQNFKQKAVANYLSALQNADLPIIQKSLVTTIRKADTNERMYRYFVEIFDFFLNDPLSGMREEQWIEPVWKQMLKSKWCTLSDSTRINFFLKMADKNRVGTKATDLDFIDSKGVQSKLSDIKAERLLVYFYIPGCEQCAKTREWIEEDTAYQIIHDAGILKVLAFYPEKDTNLFKSYQSTIPSTWINAHDLDGRSQLEDEQKYQMRGAPTMFLLDKDKTIILKDAREDLLFKEFEKAKQLFLKK